MSVTWCLVIGSVDGCIFLADAEILLAILLEGGFFHVALPPPQCAACTFQGMCCSGWCFDAPLCMRAVCAFVKTIKLSVCVQVRVG